MKFTKMHGIGNDYIYVNCFSENVNLDQETIKKLSDRHFGIGGDGVILICPSEVADAKMQMFNADGSEGQMCGNGIRCVGKYVYEHGIAHQKKIKIETLAGIKELNLHVNEFDEVESIEVQMGEPKLEKENIPVLSETPQVINMPLDINGHTYYITCVSMGNPHCVIYVKDVASLDLDKIGTLFENNPIFPERINTEFVEMVGKNEFKMRVWERGSGETLACGTGACASVVASYYNHYLNQDEEITVHLLGGDLFITYQSNGQVVMRGSATEVFTGDVNLAKTR